MEIDDSEQLGDTFSFKNNQVMVTCHFQSIRSFFKKQLKRMMTTFDASALYDYIMFVEQDNERK